MNQNQKTVLIIGGGIAGLTAAAALGQKGVACDLVEIKPENKVLGVGIIQPGNSLRALREIGVYEECLAAGFPTDHYRYYEGDGTPIANLSLLRIADPNREAINTLPRPALNDILTRAAERAGANVRFGCTAVSMEDDGNSVEVKFSDGTSKRYDMVIGADGIRSQTRRMLFGPGYEPRFTGHGCWRFTTRRPPELTYHAMYLGVGRKAGLIPLTKETMYLLLVTNAPDDSRVPDDRLNSLLYEELEPFGGMVPQIRETVLESDEIIYVPIEEVSLTETWAKGRIVVIGDAAHASSPHIAQGAAMGIEDAVVLAQMYPGADNVPDMLQAFFKRRYDRCRFVQEVSRAVGEEGNLTDPEACRARNDRMRRDLAGGKPRPHETRLAQPI